MIRSSKILFAVLIVAAICPIAAHTQTLTVRATALQDSTGILANGIISFSPVLQSGLAASYLDGSGHTRTVVPVTTRVLNGAFTITLPDTALTTPANICFSTLLRSGQNISLLGPGYGCVQPSSLNGVGTPAHAWCSTVASVTTCAFDAYPPNLTALAVTEIGATGATGPAGPVGPAGPPGANGTGNATSIQGTPVVTTPPAQSDVLVYDASASAYSVRLLTADDFGPGFSISTFACALCANVEIGATITNPAFTVSYSAPPTSAAITNTAGISSPTTLTIPFTGATVTGAFTKTTQTSVTFTLSAVGTSTKTSNVYAQWLPRMFGGVGAASATAAVTASGSTAILSTGAVLPSVGLLASPVGSIFGPYAPNSQKIYLLLTGGTHAFVDNVTGFQFTFNAPTAVTFTNALGVTVTMYLYESSTLFSGTTSYYVKVAS